jgi:transposase
MKVHSIDLRERFIEVCESGGMTQEAVAERFGVSYRSVKELLKQWRETGDLSPRHAPGGHWTTTTMIAALRVRGPTAPW